LPATTPEIVATIGGRRVPRSEVLQWEARRTSKVEQKLGIDRTAGAIDERRRQLAEHKRDLGHERIAALLDKQVRLSALGVTGLAGLSRGRRVLSSIGLTVTTESSASAFTDWWNDHVVTNDELPLLAACPDHWIIRQGPGEWQEVVETTGGSPLASRLFIDYRDTTSLRSSPNPLYPHQITAVARLRNATPIGGLRHQLRETKTGFDMTLTAEFPAVSPPNLISGHRWHLACEFSNMIEYSTHRRDPCSNEVR
jgi:hypothetical protein